MSDAKQPARRRGWTSAMSMALVQEDGRWTVCGIHDGLPPEGG